MPHNTIKLLPGVDQNRTQALNEGAISTSNLIRFVPDKQGIALCQKIGGWTKYYSSDLQSPVRALWAWQDTNAIQYLGVGIETVFCTVTNATGDGTTATITFSGAHIFSSGDQIVVSDVVSTPSASAYNGIYVVTSATTNTVSFASTATATYVSGGLVYQTDCLSVISNGTQSVLTPRRTVSDVAVSADTNTGSSTVEIDDTGSNVQTFDTVDIRTQISVGGVVLFGTYSTTFVSANAWRVTAVNALGNPVNATSSVTNGGAVPRFYVTSGSSFVDVVLYNNGYVSGDTFPALVSTTVSGVTIYGNYTIVAIDTLAASGPSVGAGNSFRIIVSNKAAARTATNASWATSVATITVPGTYAGSGTYYSGDNITVSGFIPTGYNGTYTATAGGSGTVSYALVANPTISVSNATWSLGTATLTHSGGTAFNSSVGQTITVSGVSPTGYNGSYVVTAASSGSISYAKTPNPGAYVSGGYIVQPGTVIQNSAGMNSGKAEYIYYRTPLPLPTSTGYGVGGYGVGGYGTGVAPTAVYGNPITAVDWALDNWGEVFIACPVGGQIYQWSPTSGITEATIIGPAPTVNDGVFVAMPQRQIIAWGSTQTGIQDPLLIRWCDVNNYDQWIPLVSNQAGSYRLPKGSKIVCGIQGPQQGIIWTDLSVWAMQYSGPPYVYQFTEIGTGCGLIARKAAASMNGAIYWMSQSQFFRLGPGGVEPIKCPIWDVVFQDLDTDNLDKIRIAPNSRFNEISWFYPTVGNGGEISNYVKYNIALDQWDFGALARTAWINQSVLGPPIGAGTTNGYYIYQHETSTDADGAPINASFQTGYYSLTEAEWKIFVDQVWPDMKWGYYGGAQSAHVELTFFSTDYPGQTPIQHGPYTMDQNTTYLTPRLRGRLVSIKLESNDIGSFWRIGAMRYRYQQDGKF